MLDRSVSLWLGVVFVLIGAINVWLILQASARVRDAKASTRLMAAHRIGGYVFIALFCLIGYYMVARLEDVAAGAPPSTMIHLTLAMVLSPLIFVKVLVARYYKSYYSLLMPIGLVIFVLSFVLIGITAGPFLAHRARMETVSLAAIDLPPAAIDIDRAAATMGSRCSKCHNLTGSWEPVKTSVAGGDRESYECPASFGDFRSGFPDHCFLPGVSCGANGAGGPGSIESTRGPALRALPQPSIVSTRLWERRRSGAP